MQADDAVVTGDVGWFVDRGAASCHRCHDQNYTDQGVCLTCADRAHAGLGILCGVCAGPCTIDTVAEAWWDNQW